MKRTPENIVGAYDAKTRFSELLDRAAGGEEITITKHGTPVARLIPVTATRLAGRREVIRKMGACQPKPAAD
ncbi:MAG: type II toxin-antitoxin system prevent-host-death family antitoxin [Planctomycetales bacterium]